MKKGFTLIELLGVIILLGIIGLIAYPIINNTIRTSQEKAYKETIRTLEEAAYNYSIRYDLGTSKNYGSIKFDVLKDTGFLKDDDILNPLDNQPLEGCIIYNWDEEYKQYVFKYDSECSVPNS